MTARRRSHPPTPGSARYVGDPHALVIGAVSGRRSEVDAGRRR